ncbi:hypothetical protein STEG23_035093 [Scotinomys teguina]
MSHSTPFTKESEVDQNNSTLHHRNKSCITINSTPEVDNNSASSDIEHSHFTKKRHDMLLDSIESIERQGTYTKISGTEPKETGWMGFVCFSLNLFNYLIGPGGEESQPGLHCLSRADENQQQEREELGSEYGDKAEQQHCRGQGSAKVLLIGADCQLLSDPTTNSILFIVFLLIYLNSVLGNGLIIMLICLDTQLHTPMYFFLCLLALLDMSYVTTTMPQMLVHLLAHSQTISFAGCWMQMYVFGSLGMTEGTFFVVMAYDRYVAICYPLRYTVILNWGLCIRLAAGTCVLGFLSGLLHTFFTMSLPYCGPNKVNHYFCEGPTVRTLACMDTHIIEMVDQLLSVFMGLVPVSLIVASYIHIAKAVMKIKSTQGHYKAFSTCASHLTVVPLFYVQPLTST